MGKKVVDLTYSFNEKTIYWPTAKPFEHTQVAWGLAPEGYWYTSANFSASEHGGTHLDAPIHFGEHKWTSDQIPIDRLMGPVFVIDISDSCEKNPDYQLTVQDIQNWETKNGRIPKNSIVLIRTGWGKYWPDKKKYLGNDKPGDATNLHFPGFSKDSAKFLVNDRKVKGVGLDTASLDPGTSTDFIAHQTFNSANVYGLENIANLERLPAKGAMLIALPMKIDHGTGGPTRVVALLEK
ncbi:MAG: cyclase [Acidobacteria bacterium]|nr:MAG: cyclase [Acidobacteriota bacterium]